MVKYKLSTWNGPHTTVSPVAVAINEAREVCGYAFQLKGHPEGAYWGPARPVVWVGGTPQLLAVPGEAGVANDINEAGDVVGYLGDWGSYLSSYTPTNSVAFVHRNGTTSLLEGLPAPWSQALSINNNGLIAGTCGPILRSRVFVYDSNQNALVETLEPLPGHAATTGGYINDDGDVVGISSNQNGQDSRLFIRRNGSTEPEDLGVANAVSGINSSGMIVGSRSGRPFRYIPSGPNAGFEQFGPIGAEGCGINDAGLVVGVHGIVPFVDYPNDRPDAGFQDLPAVIANPLAVHGSALFGARAINNRGDIAGIGTRGPSIVFLLEPLPPEPNLDRHLLTYLELFRGVAAGGGGLGILPGGGPPVPIPPNGLRELRPAERDLAVGRLTNYLAAAVRNEKLGAQMHRLASELMAAAAKELEKR